MQAPAGNWSTQQLAEFLALLSSFADEASAVRRAVERAAEALEAEVGAVVRGDEVVTSVGFPPGQIPTAALVEAAAGRRELVDLPDIGPCRAIAAPLDDARSSRLVLCRFGDEELTPEDADLVRGMARVLGLTLRVVRLLEAERTAREEGDRRAAENARLMATLEERQRLLEKLSRIQRSISTRVPLQEVLDAIIAGAAELLGEDVVGLRLLDSDDPMYMMGLPRFDGQG